MKCKQFRTRCWLALALLTLAVPASAEWKEKVLYSFQGIPDGAYPAGGVVFDTAGNLYGATSQGGAANCVPISFCGTVFQLSPPTKKGGAWTETVLHIFKGVTANNDGATLEGSVVLDQAGNVYGTAAYGGTGECQLFGSRSGCGIVFELSPPKTNGGKWTEKLIYSFRGGKDGSFPWGDLTWDKQGNLYGATQYGGGYGSCNAPYYQYCGTVFKLSPPTTKNGKWTERVLYAFKSGMDGANPNGGLVFDTKGALYGTTFYGGGSQNCSDNSGVGCGTVFELKPPTRKRAEWAEEVLRRFTGNMDGAFPRAVTLGKDGDLYGAAGGGGSVGLGVVFRLAVTSGGHWIETVLHNFKADNGGRNPWSSLIFDSAGDLYGTAHAAADEKFGGVVFELKRTANRKWFLSVLYNFAGAPDAAYPASALTFDGIGNLYGTTLGGGTGQACQGGCGTVFQLQP